MARKTFAFQLYRTKREKHLHQRIDIAGGIYNHCVLLQRRYYRRFGGYINYYRLKKHVTRLKKWTRFAHWNLVGSQAVQDIIRRVDLGYQKFFRKENKRPPKLRKRWKHRSFTLTQAGWTYAGGNLLYIGGIKYRFHQSRAIEGKIKTLTIKRMPTGRFFVFFSCEIPEAETIRVKTGRTAGFDFGLRRFLTGNNGEEIEAPLPYRMALKALRQASRSFSSKQRGSANWHRARLHLARVHSHVANQRKAWHWDLAHNLCQTYDAIYLEDLELRGMQRLWGRKISDLGHGNFLRILPHVAERTGTSLGFVDRYFPSSKLCSVCAAVNHHLGLRDRQWTCSAYGTVHDRDHNAAVNIHAEGASSAGGDGVRPTVSAAD
jgi:putative transposase